MLSGTAYTPALNGDRLDSPVSPPSRKSKKSGTRTKTSNQPSSKQPKRKLSRFFEKRRDDSTAGATSSPSMPSQRSPKTRLATVRRNASHYLRCMFRSKCTAQRVDDRSAADEFDSCSGEYGNRTSKHDGCERLWFIADDCRNSATYEEGGRSRIA